jgi:predicted FMN-binding regulatory protein PaiB
MHDDDLFGIAAESSRPSQIALQRAAQRSIALGRRVEQAEVVTQQCRLVGTPPQQCRKVARGHCAITSLTGKAKLSQNKEARDRLNAAETLAARGRSELAEAMRKAG